jgi:hypothetical protein
MGSMGVTAQVKAYSVTNQLEAKAERINQEEDAGKTSA